MDFVLSTNEARVLGCLLEKERTTPEHYPLTINALINACNQKSNRDPVMQLGQEEVQLALDQLRQKGLACIKHMAGSRMAKHDHRLLDTFRFEPKDAAVICLLLLRGPMTPGEIRSRSGRLCQFESPADVENTLRDLMTWGEIALVEKRPRQHGCKASRYAHLFCGENARDESSDESADAPVPVPSKEDRLVTLEEEVATLRKEMDRLKTELGVSDAPPDLSGDVEL